MTTHPFLDEAPFLLLVDTHSLGVVLVLLRYLLTLCLSRFSFWGHHLFPSIAIVFSRLSNASDASIPTFIQVPRFPSGTSRSSLYGSQFTTLWIVLHIAQFSSSSFSSTRVLIYLFLLSDRSRSPTGYRSFKFFRSMYWAVQICLHPYSSPSPPSIVGCFSLSTLRLSATFPLRFIMRGGE